MARHPPAARHLGGQESVSGTERVKSLLGLGSGSYCELSDVTRSTVPDMKERAARDKQSLARVSHARSLDSTTGTQWNLLIPSCRISVVHTHDCCVVNTTRRKCVSVRLTVCPRCTLYCFETCLSFSALIKCTLCSYQS